MLGKPLGIDPRRFSGCAFLTKCGECLIFAYRLQNDRIVPVRGLVTPHRGLTWSKWNSMGSNRIHLNSATAGACP